MTLPHTPSLLRLALWAHGLWGLVLGVVGATFMFAIAGICRWPPLTVGPAEVVWVLVGTLCGVLAAALVYRGAPQEGPWWGRLGRAVLAVAAGVVLGWVLGPLLYGRIRFGSWGVQGLGGAAFYAAVVTIPTALVPFGLIEALRRWIPGRRDP